MKRFGALGLCLLFTGCFGPSRAELERLEIEKARQQARADELASAELDRDKQQAIWDAEHITFEIEWRFGPGFKESLKQRDSEQLQQWLRPDFVGRGLLADSEETTETASTVRERRFVSADSQELDAKAFAAALLAVTADWDSVDNVGLRVLKISKSEDEYGWRTKLLLTQYGKQGDRRAFDESEHTVEWTIEDDEQLEAEPVIDTWVVERRAGRDGAAESLFEEVTQSALLDKANVPDNWTAELKDTQQYRFGVAVEDFNRDGYLDIAVAVYEGQVQLLEGSEQLQFQEVSRELGLERKKLKNFLAAWIDFNNDGYPDLLMGDQLYRSEAGRQFVNVTRESGLFIHDECMGATVADYDGDGLLDLYVLYQRDWTGAAKGAAEKWVNEEETGKANELWKNLGEGRFVNVTERAKAGGGKHHTQSAAFFHYDDDHLPDLYAANDFGKNVLLRNTGKGFEDVSEASAAGGFATSMGVAAGDLNNDGVNEIYVANMFSKMGRRIIAQVDTSDYPDGVYDQILGSCAGNRLYVRGSGAEPFREVGEARGVNQVGWAFAPALADFNNDGLLDIYATTGFMSFNRGKPDG